MQIEENQNSNSSRYSHFTFMQYLIKPQLFVSYLKYLKQKPNNQNIKNIFHLYSQTLFQWITKQYNLNPQNQTLTLHKIIHQKYRFRRMFILLILIGIHGQIDYSFFDGFLKNKQYMKFYIESLKINKKSQTQYFQILNAYFQLKFLYEQIRTINKQQTLITYQKNGQQQVFECLNIIANAQLNNKQIIDQEFKKVFYGLILDMSIGLKLTKVFSYLQNKDNIFCNKLMKQLIGIQQRMQIQQQNIKNDTKITKQLTLNKLFVRCKYHDRVIFIDKKMNNIMNSLSQKQIVQTKILIHLLVKQIKIFQQKINYFCNLLAIKVIQFTFKYLKIHKSNPPNLITQFIDTTLIKDFQDILELASPSLKNVKWIVLSLTFMSNIFQKDHYQKICKFIEGLLITFKKQANDKNYTLIVLILALFQIKGSGNDIDSKVISIWKHLVENKILMQQINSIEILQEIILISFNLLFKKNQQKQEKIESEFLSQKMVNFINFDFMEKTKFAHLNFNQNFSQKQLYNLISKQNSIIRKTTVQYDQKSAKLLLNSELKKITYYLSHKQQRLFLKSACQFITTYSYFPYKKQKVLNSISLISSLNQNNLNSFFKKISIILSNMKKLQLSIIALQYTQWQINYQQIRKLLDQNLFTFEKKNILNFITNLQLLKFLLKYYYYKKDSQKVAVLNLALLADTNYQFYSESKKKKIIFKRQVDFSFFLLESLQLN